MAEKAVAKVGFTEIIIEERIGSGAYGTVFKAMCNKLPCAAKKIHEALVQPHEGATDAHEHRAPFRRFESEFQLLQELRHSNIIQYLGMHVDPETKLPVLLMELLDTNLTNYFERNLKPLSYHIQVNLSLDIMRALLFLHVNKIVHRDLSGGNILLVANPLKAKVSDFGMAKFLNADMSRLTHTNAPGTIAYMPPEAFGDEFKESGDIFSFAVLLIQILTQKFPEPQGSRYADRIIDDEKIQVLVKESERRQNHISLIREDHPLLPIALDCLKNNEMDRPLASDLCDRLISLSTTAFYTDSKEAEENLSSIVKEKESFEFSDYIFITDEEKLTQTQQALQKSEVENKGVKDILEAKLKVLDNLVKRNDEMLKIQKQNEEVIEQKETKIQKLSDNKAENEQKMKNLELEIEKKQQTINEQQKESDFFKKKIAEQNIRITNQLETIAAHDIKIIEQNIQITNQLKTIAEQDLKLKTDQEQISQHLETIAKHEEHINELSLQLEQQSAVLSLQEEKIEELLSQIPAKKKKKPSVDNDISFFERMKRTFTSAKPDDTDQEKISQHLETIAKHEEHINELSLQLEQQSTVLSLKEEKIEELLSQIPAKKKKKPSVDNDISFLERMKRTFASAKPDDTHKLDETKSENVNQDLTSTPLKETISPAVNATTTESDFSLPGIENLKQTDSMHKDSGLTKSIADSWEKINETDITQATEPGLQAPLDAREKAGTERLATATDNVITTLNDIQKIETETNQTPQKLTKSLNEPVQKGRKEHKVTPKSSSPKASSTKPQKTKRKPSSSFKLTKKFNPSVNPFDDDSDPLGAPSGVVTTSAMKSREQSAIERMEASSARSVRTLVETNRLGIATNEELAIQGEKLDGIERCQEKMNNDLAEGAHNIETVKSPFGRSRKKKISKNKPIEHTPPPKKRQAQPTTKPLAEATTQLRRLPSLGSAVLDENAERMSELLSDLKVQAINQGEMLDRQNGQVDRIQRLTDLNHAGFTTANKNIRKQL